MTHLRQAVKTRMFWMEVLIRLVLVTFSAELPLNVLTEDVHIYWHRAHDLSIHYLPYRDFLWEYPPLSAFLLLLVPITLHSENGFATVLVALMMISEYASLCILRKTFKAQADFITAYWSLTVLPLAMLGWFRLDFLAILLATIALTRLHRNQSAGTWIVLGFLAKLWPILFVARLILQRSYKKLVVVIAWCVVLTVAWYAFSPHGFHEFLRYRKGGGFQIESIPGSLLLLFTNHPVIYEYGALNVFSHRLEWISLAMSVAAVVIPLAILAYAFVCKIDNWMLVVLSMLVWTLCLSRLISAQYVLWLVPFVAIMARQYKLLGALFFVVASLTSVEVFTYHPLLRRAMWPDIALALRNLFLIALAIESIRLVLASRAGETYARTESAEPAGLPA